MRVILLVLVLLAQGCAINGGGKVTAKELWMDGWVKGYEYSCQEKENVNNGVASNEY